MFFLIFLPGTIKQNDSLLLKKKNPINFVSLIFLCLCILSTQSIFYHLAVTLIFIVTHFSEFNKQITYVLSYQKQSKIKSN